MENINNLFFECACCGNKYGIQELCKKLNTYKIFQSEYEYKCMNCNGNEFNIQFEKQQ